MGKSVGSGAIKPVSDRYNSIKLPIHAVIYESTGSPWRKKASIKGKKRVMYFTPLFILNIPPLFQNTIGSIRYAPIYNNTPTFFTHFY